MITITTASKCAQAVSALDLADNVDADDVHVANYWDRKDGCTWHTVHLEANLFSGSTIQDEPCNYRNYAGCICAKPEFALVTDANSCEAVGMTTITTTSRCAEAISTLDLAENVDASDITVTEYYDRKDGCIWHAVGKEATLFSGSTRQDQPCNYRGYAGCVCANQQTKEPSRAPTTPSPTQKPTPSPTDLSTSEYVMITDANSCEAAEMITITTASKCAQAVSALDLADNVDADDVHVANYWDRKDGCTWHTVHLEANLFSGSTIQDEPCNYRNYAGCICAKPEFALVTDANSCEAVGMTTITTTSRCAEAISTLDLAENVDASDITVTEYYDRKDGCIWHAVGKEATLFSGSTRQDQPCNYRGYAGCVCANAQTALVKGPKEGCESGYVQPATPEDCQAVAEANNVRYWGGMGHSSSADPQGCIYRIPDNDIYFNTHSKGSTNRNDRNTVCVKEHY